MCDFLGFTKLFIKYVTVTDASTFVLTQNFNKLIKKLHLH